MVAASGEQYEITGHGYRAVVTECGGGLRLLEYDGRPIVAGYPEDLAAPAGRGQLLLPWPNRVEDGSYTFDGTTHQLALSEPARANAIHGLTRWASWSLEEQASQSVSLMCRLMAQKGYPWTLDLHVLYDLSPDGLTVTVTATNMSPSAAPYAQGAHPYLSVGDDPIDGWELTVPAGTWVEVDGRMLPSGHADVAGSDYDFREPRALKGVSLDTAFTGLGRDPDGRAEVRLRNLATDRAVGLWMDRKHPWVQIYTGDDLDPARGAVAVEPMTAPPNAFRSREDLVVLTPAGTGNDEHSSSWGIHAI